MKTPKFQNGDIAQICQFGDGLDGTLVNVIGISSVSSSAGDAFLIVKKCDGTLFQTAESGSWTTMVITQHCLQHS